MPAHDLFKFVPLFSVLACAVVTDLRARRIPNLLTFPLILGGLIQSFLPNHTCGPAQAILGMLLGLALLMFPLAINAVGGGDAKILAGIGAWVGPQTIFIIFLVEAVIGMFIVLLQAAWQKKLAALARNTAVVAINMAHIREMGAEHVTQTGRTFRSIARPLPYAVPVMLATLWVLAKGGGL